MFVTPIVVAAFVKENDGAWPRSWEELQAGPQPKIFVHQDSIDYEVVRRHVVIDFDSDPSELARQSPESFVAIRAIDPVYSYSHDVKHLIETLKRYHIDDL